MFDEIEPPRERFYDERDEEPELPEWYGCCGACDEYDPCPFPGHEGIGYCSCQGEWHRADDPDECD